MLYVVWTIKYKPRSKSEIVGNSECIQTFVEWVKSWDQGTPKNRAAFLYGPPGIGKTATVEALANEFRMDFVEKNASDYRTEDAINHFAGLASQYRPLFGGKRLVLLDELDGLSGAKDKGGVKAITEVVKTAACPVVLISNSGYDQRFATLRNHCLLLEFKKPSAGEVMKHLSRICSHEGIQIDESALKFIAQRSEGDVRSAVNDFQMLAQGKKQLKYEDVSWIAYRDRQDSIFNVLRMILYGKTCLSAKRAVDMTDVDVDMLFEWIYENVPLHLADPHDLARALDALSIADVYRGRIRSSQDWGLTRYVIDFMTAGVAMARQNTKASGWIPFRFPGRIHSLSISRADRAMQLSIGQKLKRKSHTSAFRASKQILPYLKVIFKSNLEMAAGIVKWLDLDREMIEYLGGSEEKAEAIIKQVG